MTASSTSAFPVLAGQLCTRTLAEGTVQVGLLQLPPGFVPQEGVAYLLVEDQRRLFVQPRPLTEPMDESQGPSSISDWVHRPIWPRTGVNFARPVRFIEAFPESNHWAMVAPSHHDAPAGQPAHLWQTLKNGRLETIPAPMEAQGLGLGQLLTLHPVWPGPDGERYTLSQHPARWRPGYLRYHQLLARAAREPTVDQTLETTIAQDPELRNLSFGKVDRQYCAFLAALEDKGLLTMDGPRRADQVLSRDQLATTLAEASIVKERTGELESLADALKVERPRQRRSP